MNTALYKWPDNAKMEVLAFVCYDLLALERFVSLGLLGVAVYKITKSMSADFFIST